MKLIASLFVLFVFVSIPTRTLAKEKDKGNFIPCQTVFVTGNQPYSVQWANKNLFKHTCMAPQANPNQATAILDLEPIPGVYGAPNYTPKENTRGYWINCHSAILGGVTCEDSEGHQTTTTCSFVGGYVSCSTYEGPDPVTALIRSLVELLVRNSAYAQLYDAKTHELLWKYQGSWPWDNELMFDSACAKKRRAGTWGTSGGVPNGLSCDEKKLPTDLLTSGATPQVLWEGNPALTQVAASVTREFLAGPVNALLGSRTGLPASASSVTPSTMNPRDLAERTAGILSPTFDNSTRLPR